MAKKVKDLSPLTWKEYLQALPFCVAMLVVPLLPTVILGYVLKGGRAPLAGILILLLTFGYPVLRVKKPRLAWWVGTLSVVASAVGLVIATVVIGTLFRYWVVVTLGLAVGFIVLNKERLRPWTFLVFAGLMLYHVVPLGAGRVFLAVLGMGLVGLYFRLADRDNFPLAPIVVTLATALLLAHGGSFYLDIGGEAQITKHAAASEVFRYTGQRRGWVRVVGGNPHFLSPACKDDFFYVGTGQVRNSALVVIKPQNKKHKQVVAKVPLRGGINDNLIVDCRSRSLMLANSGTGEVLALDMLNPDKVLARERLEGMRVGVLRLDRRRNWLFVGVTNKPYLIMLRAKNLAEFDRFEMSAAVSDIAVDDAGSGALFVATDDGKLVRMMPKLGSRLQTTHMVDLDFGRLVYNLALDRVGRRLFAVSLFGREVVVLNADTLEIIGRTRLPRGARFMQYDAQRDLLYVGSFFFGTVSAHSFDAKGDGTQVWSVEVGRRVRYLTIDAARDQLCFTSQVGGYCLNLETLSPKPQLAPTPTPETPAATDEPTPTAVPDTTPPAPAGVDE